MTNPVAPPAAPTVPVYPALGSTNFNQEAYTYGSSMPAVSARIGAIGDAAYTNAVAADERAVAANNSAVTATAQADAAMGYRNTAQSAATTATTKAAEADASAIAASKLNLGDKAVEPTTDNQGAPLRVGATYYDTTLGKWRVWTGSGWGDGVTSGVLSVAGKSGTVTLNSSDVGLDNVDNTRDVNKPISSAVQTALNAKLTGDNYRETSLDQTNLIGWESTINVSSRGARLAAWGDFDGFPIITAKRPAAGDYVWWIRNVITGQGVGTAIGAASGVGVAAECRIVSGGQMFSFTGLGQAWKPGGGVWADSSDARLKDGITDWSTGLAAVKGLRVRQWTYKPETGRDPTKVYRGFIAQEAELVAPTLVSSGPGEVGTIKLADLRTVDASDLLYILVNAVKELDARIAVLEAKP